MAELGVDGFVLFAPDVVAYATGFGFVPTERPIVAIESVHAESCLVVPFLEAAHARAESGIEQVLTYDEFPADAPAMHTVVGALRQLGLDSSTTRLGIDYDGYPPVMGYWGPSLSELVAARLVPASRTLDRVLMVKTAYEVELLRESSRWAVRAHELLQAYTRPGLTETEVSQRASSEATLELARALPGYRAGSMTFGAHAGYRGQIGRRSALPHTLAMNSVFESGDTLVTGATAPMAGYVSELERTMFIGEPADRPKSLFQHMRALQDLCLAALRPGVTAASVDRAMREYVDGHGLWPLWRHHVGHGIGRRYHEAPFLDRGDDTLLEPGMVLTVEPGLYDPDWGGFRHSDTVVVTETGVESLTAAYPRDIESLIIPA
jgi:Xaa-Pro aminopeptidase